MYLDYGASPVWMVMMNGEFWLQKRYSGRVRGSRAGHSRPFMMARIRWLLLNTGARLLPAISASMPLIGMIV